MQRYGLYWLTDFTTRQRQDSTALCSEAWLAYQGTTIRHAHLDWVLTCLSAHEEWETPPIGGVLSSQTTQGGKYLGTLDFGDVPVVLQLHPVGFIKLGPNQEI